MLDHDDRVDLVAQLLRAERRAADFRFSSRLRAEAALTAERLRRSLDPDRYLRTMRERPVHQESAS